MFYGWTISPNLLLGQYQLKKKVLSPAVFGQVPLCSVIKILICQTFVVLTKTVMSSQPCQIQYSLVVLRLFRK